MSTYEPLSPENRAALAELIGAATRPAATDLLLRLGHTVKDCRTHDHGMGGDLFCGNQHGWMGERIALVMRRLLDAEAAVEQARRIAVQLENECARLTAERVTLRAAVLREAADDINALPQDYECDPGRGDAADPLRSMADGAGKDTCKGESTRAAEPGFFQPGRTYTDGTGYTAPEVTTIFQVECVTRHPDRGHLRAIGWSRTGKPGARWHGDFRDEGEFDGWTDVTEGGGAV